MKIVVIGGIGLISLAPVQQLKQAAHEGVAAFAFHGRVDTGEDSAIFVGGLLVTTIGLAASSRILVSERGGPVAGLVTRVTEGRHDALQ